MYKILLAVLFAFAVSNCSAIQSQDNKNNNSMSKTPPISANASNASENTVSSTAAPTPADNRAAINEKDFTITKFSASAMKKTTLDKLPPEIVKYILDNESSDPPRSPQKITVSVQDRDFNQDGLAEKMIYYRQYNNDEGVPLLLVFKNDNNKWDKLIFLAEGAPDEDIPEIEFLTKPGTKDFDIIKETLLAGGGSDIIYLQMKDTEYKPVECRKATSAESKIVPCNS